jgi:hypothetical protein
MAQTKDLLTRLADAGEDALNRLSDAPGMDRMLGFANSTKDRLDELTKRVRGIEQLEKRVAKLEKQVAAIAGTAPSSSKRAPAKRSAAKRAPAKRSPG